MNRDDPFFSLYMETVPHRISSPKPGRMADGPTARWADLETQRAAWALVLVLGDDDEVGAA